MRTVLCVLVIGLLAAAPAAAQSDLMPPVPSDKPTPQVIAPAFPDLGCANTPRPGLCCPEPCADGWQARVSADYLLWWVRSGPTPPLLTTGPLGSGGEIAGPATLGANGTVTLFGDKPLSYGAFSGGRLTLDTWLDSAGLGVQVGGFALEQRSVGFRAASDATGNPILAQPYFDVLANASLAQYVTFPNALAGGVAIASTSRLWGLESNLTGLSFGGGDFRGHLLAGFRYVDLAESLGSSQNQTVLPDGTAFLNGFQLNTGDTLVLADAFHTRNQFYGGQVGVEGEWQVGPLTLGATAKVALGSMHEVVQVQGSTFLLAAGVPGITDSAPAGVLAQDTNSGTTRKNTFAVVPELNLKVSYHITENLLASLGYSFLYISDVARPGSQIDPGINLTHVPSSELFGLVPEFGPARPAPLFNHSDFWAQGISFGLELRF